MNGTYIQLQKMIASLYNDMLPTAFQLTAAAQGLAGIAALIYVFYRIWPVLAGKEPLDLFPMLRPFGFMLLLLFYQSFIFLLGAVLQPIADATGRIYAGQYKDVIQLIDNKQKILEQQNTGDQPDASAVGDPVKEENQNWVMGIVTGAKNALPHFDPLPVMLSKALSWILEFLFSTVSIVISTLRAFFLIVLVTIGPISIAFSIFPAFAGTFNGWLARYIQIWMWAPIASILGALLSRIQTLMELRAIERATAGTALDIADIGHLAFLLVGIVCYSYVPTMASWVIESSGVGRALGHFNVAGKGAVAGTGAILGKFAGTSMNAGKKIAEMMQKG